MADEAENVTQLITKPPDEYVKPPRYVSKYRDQIEEEYKRGKSAHKTLGVPTIDPDNPANFLRKRSQSAPKKAPVAHQHYRRPDYQRKLPEWKPIKASEKDKMQPSVDIMKRNVEDAVHMKTGRKKLFYVDDRHGTRRPLKYSGLLPIYIYREDYGQVPGKDFSPPRRRSNWGETKIPGMMKRSDFKDESRRQKASPGRRSPGRRPKSQKRETAKGRKSKDPKSSPGRGVSPGRPGALKKSAGKSPRRKTSPRPGDKRKETRAGKKGETEAEKVARERKKFEREQRKSERERRETERKKRKSEREKRKSERKLAGEDEDEDDTESEKSEPSEDEKSTDKESSTASTTSEEKSKSEEKSQGSRSTGSILSRRTEASESTFSVEYKKPKCRYVTEDERAELLYGMKKKWDEMMNQFQLLPFVTDTPPKAKRKSKMEKDLLQLEKDIETIEQHPYIYVYSDPED